MQTLFPRVVNWSKRPNQIVILSSRASNRIVILSSRASTRHIELFNELFFLGPGVLPFFNPPRICQVFLLGPNVQRDSLFSFNSFFGVQASRQASFEFPAIFQTFKNLSSLFFGVRTSREILCFQSTLFWGPDVQRNSLFILGLKFLGLDLVKALL